MTKRTPYGLISDTHNHRWAQFAVTNTNGVNSRLQTILDETYRAAHAIRALGGNKLFHAGDMFHVRGSVDPEVLNPTKDLYKKLIEEGFEIHILAGNHDLSGKESTRIGSAVTALEDVGCEIVNMPTMFDLGDNHFVMMIPWMSKVPDLRNQIALSASSFKSMFAPGIEPGICDLIIHAPVDGVIFGLPDHGLDATYLQAQGFDKVFSGHYHCHKNLGAEVYSIGALTHHTWGDIGSKAGFVTVDGRGLVKYNASHAPSFIEITSSVDPADIPMIVPGNFVRCKIDSSKATDASAVRHMLESAGAAGVVVLQVPATLAPTRATATVTAGESMEGSVASYIASGTYPDKAKLNSLCADILSTVKAAA